ncbi:MAG: hypothetical protein MI919_15780, partial [Holophagales bacterium]|nr:hypothetical protein [Holophagales bacterium]
MFSIRAFLFVLALFPIAGMAAAGDVSIRDIDTSAIRCGGCPGTLKVDVYNRGKAIGKGYTISVELRVVPHGYTHNTRKFTQRFRGIGEYETRTLTFRDVKLINCNQDASTFEVKVAVTGGNYRDPNTRNNEKSVSEPIRKRCPRSGGSGGGGS